MIKAIIVGCVTLLALLLYGSMTAVPNRWSSDLINLTCGKIYQRIGPPQESATAKEFENWNEMHWWGFKQLKIITRNGCAAERKPDELIYSAHLRWRYKPMFLKVIATRTSGE
jgi:hypothetical protein